MSRDPDYARLLPASAAMLGFLPASGLPELTAAARNNALLRLRRWMFCLRSRLNLALSPLNCDIACFLRRSLAIATSPRLPCWPRVTLRSFSVSGEDDAWLLDDAAPYRETLLSQSRRRRVDLRCV